MGVLRRQLGPVPATLAAFLPVALVNALFILIGLEGPAGVRLHALGYELAQLGLLALLCAGLVAGWQRVAAGRTRLALATLWLVSLGLGFWLLRPDLDNFARRMTPDRSHWLVLVPVVLLVASAPPLTWLIAGHWGHRVWRALLLVGAIAAAVINGRVLPADYPGVHLFAFAVLVLAARAALLGARATPPAVDPQAAPGGPRWRRALLLAAALAIGLSAVLVPPPGPVATAWSRYDGSVLMPFVGRAQAQLQGDPSEPGPDGVGADPWFQDRAGLAAIPARSFAAIPADPIVIFLTVEALRADVVNSRRFDAQIPTLAALRDRGVQFEQARAAGSKTIPSMAALFSGVYFSQQYWAATKNSKTAKPNTTQYDTLVRFPELLRDAGVRTLHAYSLGWLTKDNGLVRGFEDEFYVTEQVYPAMSSVVVAAMIEKLSQPVEGPLFFYAHWYDPHHPYNSAGVPGSPFDGFVGEVGLIDRSLAQLVAFIRERGLDARTYFIISADHGEAFGEHGTRYHTGTLYEELLRVPLLIAGPGIAPRSVGQNVGLIDVAPTVLELFGQPTPGHFMGQSLVPLLFGENPQLTRPIVAETMLRQAMVFDSGLKVIVDNRLNRREAYDLRTDPGELRNIVESDPRVAPALGLLRAFFQVHTLRREGYHPPYFR